jgi:hypothetical protein
MYFNFKEMGLVGQNCESVLCKAISEIYDAMEVLRHYI